MATGTVKFFNGDKGYGFISPEGGGADVFVHISALETAGISALKEGDRVSFDAVMDQRKGKTNAQKRLHNDHQRLARLADRLDIQELLYRYARAVDRKDWDAVRAVYHPDAYDAPRRYS